jgi:hypothetical protein
LDFSGNAESVQVYRPAVFVAWKVRPSSLLAESQVPAESVVQRMDSQVIVRHGANVARAGLSLRL